MSELDRILHRMAERPAEPPAPKRRGRVPRLAGVHEVAALLGITKGALGDRRRGREFPKPLAQLECGTIWDLDEIERYKASYRRAGSRR